MTLQNFIDYFRSKSKNTASIAKERLQIIVSHERGRRRNGPDYLPKLKEELLAVIAKYVPVKKDQVRVEWERNDKFAILELNVTLPDKEDQ